MDDSVDFLWMFPCYILAKDYKIGGTGEIVFDEKIRFATPEITPGGDRHVAIFTDSDLAEQFREMADNGDSLRLLDLKTPAELAHFLRLANSTYHFVIVDPNRKTNIARSFLIAELIRQLDSG